MLTERQLEITEWICYGSTDKEIASALVISEETVGTLVQRALQATGARDRSQLAYWAVRSGQVAYCKEGISPDSFLNHPHSWVLPHIAEGKTNGAIGNLVTLDEDQVQTMIRTLKRKAGASTRAELAAAYAAYHA